MVSNDSRCEEHLFKTHFDTKTNCNIQLPTKGDKLAFCDSKNLSERPFIEHAEFESSLIPTGESEKIQMHKANSACCYFVCTYDSSRNKLYEIVGESCVIELLNTLKIIAGGCIKEMKTHTDIEISKGTQHVKRVEECYLWHGEFTKL